MSGLAYTSGHIVGARYRLRSRLGAGGMGEVWQAEHLTLKSLVAIKFISPALAVNADALQRFMREAQSAAALRSTHIVQVFDFGIDREVPYIAMELLQGESLRERLQRERVLTPAATGTILTHVARAMAYAHDAGIVHRDLKPDNIFIVREQDTEIIKVLDFGVAKVTGGSADAKVGGGTMTGAMLGTPFYVSPEQARGNKAVDFRSDLWSLGVITYECVTGRRPFASDGLGDLLLQICSDPPPPPSTVARVPQGLDAWMAQALDKNPEGRFGSAQQMAEAFQALVRRESQPASFPAEGPAMPAQPSPSVTHGLAVTTAPDTHARASLPWLAVGGALALLGVGGTAAWWATAPSNAVEASSSTSTRPGVSVRPSSAVSTLAETAKTESPTPSPVPSASVEPLTSAVPVASAKPSLPAPAGRLSRRPEPAKAPTTASAPEQRAPRTPVPSPPATPERGLFDDRL